MKLTSKLVGYLPRTFYRRPDAAPALRISHVGQLTWRVSDARLTTLVVGDPAASLDLDLTQFTVSELAAEVGAAAGYTAAVVQAEFASLGAHAIIDGEGDSALDLAVYTDVEWAWMDAAAAALQQGWLALAQMLRQLRIDLAEDDWLDYWTAKLLRTRRIPGETDAVLLQRVQAEVLAIKSSNLGIEEVVHRSHGINVRVLDMPWVQSGGLMYTHGGALWDPSMITNSAAVVCGPGINARPDTSVIADFALPTLPSGMPYWGLAANRNLMLCAFAVVFEVGTDAELARDVMATVQRTRQGGTVGLPYLDVNAGPPYQPWAL